MTKRQREAVKAYAESGMSASGASKKLRKHRNSVCFHLGNIKVGTGLDPKNFFDLIKLYEQAVAEDEVKKNASKGKKKLTREQDKRAKVADEQVEEIYRLYDEGYTQKAIAEMFGITQQNVCYILGRAYRRKEDD